MKKKNYFWVGGAMALALGLNPDVAFAAVGAEALTTSRVTASFSSVAEGVLGQARDAKAGPGWLGSYQEARVATPPTQLKTCLGELKTTQESLAAAEKTADELKEKVKLAEAQKPPVGATPATGAASPGPLGTPFGFASTKSPVDTLVLLLVAGLMGMVGQGARTIVGLKKVSDASDTDPSEADSFKASRIFIGLMIGFVAGVAGGLTAKVFDARTMTGDVLFYLASIGYIGVDVIEGFAHTVAGGKRPQPAREEPRDGKAPGGGVPPVHEAPHGRPSSPVENFKAKAPGVMAELMNEFGLEDHHAAGVAGNLGEESNGFMAMQEVHPIAGRGGLGWAQWTGSRRVAFEDFCHKNSLDPRSDAANLGFLKHELHTTHAHAISKLKQQETLSGAVESFMNSFEKPGVPHLEVRVRWAERALDAYHQAKALA